MTGKNSILGGGGFHHVCIKTREWDRTMGLYVETLGFTVKLAWGAAPKRGVLLDAGAGDYLEVFEDPEFSPAPNGSVLHFALRTTRLEEVIERVRASGMRITMEPKDVTLATTNGAGPVSIRIGFFAGPSAELVELFQNEMT